VSVVLETAASRQHGGRKPPIIASHESTGEFTIDAAVLAERFRIPASELRSLMARGLVKSMVEIGEGDDKGTWRLSIRCGNRIWSAIVQGDGRIGEEKMRFSSAQSAAERN
jgi:hypothetical protein